ncbi:FAD-dependent oxidoreductase [Wenzhouxiangella sp. XN201]|uniref:FAD-dependent oxidoreductase n=1 Tax=Wenzhouxiangella sp. XN201 TaxID=2710755 RepID=UPI0013C8FC42|nr:FAD-dependent oxidoreductase [Wenzhouxiangella sp. XN201]NEZ04300.1 FAD-dependent oxidoreductase [Wenzhouxiangella sp. XN201]
MKRRQLLQGLLAAPLVWPLAGLQAAESRPDNGRRVVVVGAGAFGGWTALRLAQSGAQVTLIERFSPGHFMSSSGGDSRVIRHMYTNPLYVRMVERSLALYRQADREWHKRLLHPIGVLFMRQPAGAGFFEAGKPALSEVGIEHERLGPEEIAARWPQIGVDGLDEAIYEPQAGYLMARRACEAVYAALQRAGGRVVAGQAKPGTMRSGRLESARLPDGSEVRADDFVFACGPWLPELFSEVLGPVLETSRQDIYYFSPPTDGPGHSENELPVWADFGERLWYGIPGNRRWGFKVADDTRGEPVEPQDRDRQVDHAHVEMAREFMRRRFPAMGDAALEGARFCQYTNTPDGDFILDRHPEAANLWLVGGGSGHGFKHGPALGELVAESVLRGEQAEPAFALSRFDRQADANGE